MKGNMGNTIQTLSEFIDAAEKSRNYPGNTAGALRSSLKLFEKELTDEEHESLDIFKEHIDKIYQAVVNNNKTKMAIQSLETYKRRMSGLLKDYDRYGTDPTKMANWNRKTRNFKKGKQILLTGDRNQTQQSNDLIDNMRNIQIDRIELSLRPGAKAVILFPSDLTSDEAQIIKSMIDARVMALKK